MAISSAPARMRQTKTAARERCRNIPNGSTGLVATRWVWKNHRSTRAPANRAMTMVGLSPLPASARPKTSSVDADVASIAPRTSRLRRSCGGVAVSTAAPAKRMNAPMGTLIKKIQRQLASVKAPPMTRPSTEPRPVIIANTEKALFRGFPGGKVTTMSAIAVGEATAAPMP